LYIDLTAHPPCVLPQHPKGKKYVAEWVDDAPICGTILDLASDDLEPAAAYGLADSLERAAAKHQLKLSSGRSISAAEDFGSGAGAAGGQSALPVIHLAQPSKMLAREFVAIRSNREASKPAPAGTTTISATTKSTAATASPAGRRLPATLSPDQIELLRLAFTLMAGSNGRRARLLPRQLPELAVLSGLDPAAPATIALLHLVRSHGDADGGAIGLDALLHAAVHFREQPLVLGLRDRTFASGSHGSGEAEEGRLAQIEAAADDDDEFEAATSSGAGSSFRGLGVATTAIATPATPSSMRVTEEHKPQQPWVVAEEVREPAAVTDESKVGAEQERMAPTAEEEEATPAAAGCAADELQPGVAAAAAAEGGDEFEHEEEEEEEEGLVLFGDAAEEFNAGGDLGDEEQERQAEDAVQER